VNPQPESPEQVFEKLIDAPQDGRVELFLLILRNITGDVATDMAVCFWFRLCDRDDDGVLSLWEITELCNLQYERMNFGG
jgi:hypothetical protein